MGEGPVLNVVGSDLQGASSTISRALGERAEEGLGEVDYGHDVLQKVVTRFAEAVGLAGKILADDAARHGEGLGENVVLFDAQDDDTRRAFDAIGSGPGDGIGGGVRGMGDGFADGVGGSRACP
ncbi:hypothetical protein [Streptomyces cucumeris]|uniref:hypothetical protein n=1 Tax=Streptomyces cucumeris TaxID=2962890 RepID=UPI003D75AABB